MTTLHALFHLRNQQAFQRLLESSNRAQPATLAPLSSSGGRSWNKPSPLSSTSASTCDVNARDWLGRTVLHVAASSTDASALEYVKLLLTHPRIDVNAVDTESRWTALHRALYVGNLPACLLLLQRSDIDNSLKDYEGYTAFDVYNSTVEGTKPDTSGPAELFTWGANRNATLGHGDSDDRTYPDQADIPPQRQHANPQAITERFLPIHVKQVAMSRLHTAVVTNERSGNFRACGFGSGGRLGPGQHTQYALTPHPGLLEHTIVNVALGQDHTLALTVNGAVLSWGLNRFAQLGYAVDTATVAASTALGPDGKEEPIQATPRRVIGPLRKEFVCGVAACKTASVCWTGEDVFTWGTNAGQLGYDKAAQPVQVQPRKVTGVSQPVIDVAITDYAMACLLKNRDVLCFWNDRYFKINFPAINFPSEIQAYRPPTHNSGITRLTSGESTFAALSAHGELFTFSLGPPPTGTGPERSGVRPQRVWALRKQFSAVKDVALGSDGTIILCTESGHVYVRVRGAKPSGVPGTGPGKFMRVPYLQRVVRVAANSTGAFAALRVDARPDGISADAAGASLSQDLASVRPYVVILIPDRVTEVAEVSPDAFRGTSPASLSTPTEDDADEETEDRSIKEDIAKAQQLCSILARDREARKGGAMGVYGDVPYAHGADVLVQLDSSFAFPAHRVVLAARSAVLARILRGQEVKEAGIGFKLGSRRRGESAAMDRLLISGCHPLTVLILVDYFYSDEVLAVWDRRIGLALEHHISGLRTNIARTRTELQTLARLCNLPDLSLALEAHAKRVPRPSLSTRMHALFAGAQESQKGSIVADPASPLAPNVILELSDKLVFCHATVLRARSAFFAGIFGDTEWTAKRWRPDRVVLVNLRHLNWRVMEPVMQHIYCGLGTELFDTLESTQSVDDVLQFLFDVVAAASELLLDRLILICSNVILKFVYIHNVGALLADATHFHADTLVERLQLYIACNMETMLDSRMMDDLDFTLVKQLGVYVRSQQAMKLPVTRSYRLVERALDKHAAWLELQDIPQPIVRSTKRGPFRTSPKLSPASPGKLTRQPSGPLTLPSPPTSPTIRPQLRPGTSAAPATDDIFEMDEQDTGAVASVTLPQPVVPTVGATPWKSKAGDLPNRIDLRAIIAEAESSKSVLPTIAKGPAKVVGFEALPKPGQASTPRRGQPDQHLSQGLERTDPDASTPGPNRTASSSPWRLLSSSPATIPAAVPSAVHTFADSSKSTPPSGLSRAITEHPGVSSANASPSPSRTASSSTRAAGKQGMGPTFTPTRQAGPLATSSVSRRTSDGPGKSWSANAMPVVHDPSPSTSPPSFLAIQQQQRDQGLAPTKVKSLLEIQAEEREKQAEDDFMRWWAAEEERIRLETQPPSIPDVNARNKGSRSSRRKPPFKGNTSTLVQEAAESPTESTRTHGSQRSRRDKVPQKPSTNKPHDTNTNTMI